MPRRTLFIITEVRPCHTFASKDHRLWVPERIQFRLAVQVYRCRHNLAPLYLANDLHWTDESEALQRLRSGARQRLIIPRTRVRTIGDRAFGVAASCVWNSLPPVHQLTPVFQKTTENFSVPELTSLALVLS